GSPAAPNTASRVSLTASSLSVFAVPASRGDRAYGPFLGQGRQRPQESAGNVPSKRGASVPRSAVLRQSPNVVAGHPSPQSAPVDNLDQSPRFEPPDGPSHVPAVQPRSPGEVVVRGPRCAVPGVALQHQPDGDSGPAQLPQNEVNKGVEHGEALPRLPL